MAKRKNKKTRRLTPELRLRVMRSIRKRNTKPELRVRQCLHRMGFRFRIHSRSLPGAPDVVLPRFRTVIFVHGCFWHWHTCDRARLPRRNLRYWKPKLARNKERDVTHIETLMTGGWNVVVVWECEIATMEDTTAILRQRLPKEMRDRLAMRESDVNRSKRGLA